MSDESTGRGQAGFADAALDWFRRTQRETDDAVEAVKATPASDGMRLATINAAVAAARSNREVAAAMITSTEILDSSITAMNGELHAFTTATNQTSDRLARWTMVMALATAALVLTSLAQIVVALFHS